MNLEPYSLRATFRTGGLDAAPHTPECDAVRYQQESPASGAFLRDESGGRRGFGPARVREAGG